MGGRRWGGDDTSSTVSHLKLEAISCVYSLLLGQHKSKNLNDSRLEINSLDGNDDYFNCWLIALEEIIISKKLVNSNILSLLKKDWTNAYLSTPHGKPVNIK